MLKSLLFSFVAAFLVLSCEQATNTPVKQNGVSYAKGLSIAEYRDFKVVTVTEPWPGAKSNYRYVLHKKGFLIPDSLSTLPAITIPVKRVIATSTTHLPSIEMLGESASLVGFPMLDYISSPIFRAAINAGAVQELGTNQNLNIEAMLSLKPDVVISFGIDNSNPIMDKVSKAGIPVIFNGDWNETTPLGKAEWIKLFGVLYDKADKADSIFNSIESEYNRLRQLAAGRSKKPRVMAGSVYQNQWYVPKGGSWGALLIRDAGGDYLWKQTEGTGSLALSPEEVLLRSDEADYWIGPEMMTFEEMAAANPHYARFRAFREKNVYNFTSRKGEKGGVLYYELGPNRPDIVLKDLIKILHPDLLPDYQLFFFQKLR